MGNYYQINVDTYHKAINREVNKTYKNALQHLQFSFNGEAKQTAKELKIDDSL